MDGVFQYLLQNGFPVNYVASEIFHVPISKTPRKINHLPETAKYLLFHGVTFSTAAGANPSDQITINGVLYFNYLAIAAISGTHMVPHVVEGSTVKINCTDNNIIGTLHYQYLKFR